MNIIQKITKWYRKLPDKKRYLEFITALLSIPVLVTIVLLNITNLNKARDQDRQPGPSVSPNGGVTIIPFEVKNEQLTPAANIKETEEKTSPNPVFCRRELPPVTIISPKEGEVIVNNYISIDISYEKGEYCSIVWSYSINGSLWSEFTDKAIYLYNLPSGNKTLLLRIKSVVSGDEIVLKRNFFYVNNTESPTPSSSTQSAVVE